MCEMATARVRVLETEGMKNAACIRDAGICLCWHCTVWAGGRRDVWRELCDHSATVKGFPGRMLLPRSVFLSEWDTGTAPDLPRSRLSKVHNAHA